MGVNRSERVIELVSVCECMSQCVGERECVCVCVCECTCELIRVWECSLS